MERDSIYNNVPLTTAVARAKLEVGLESSSEWDFRFKVWAEEGARSLDTVQTFILRYECINFECGRATVPPGFKRATVLLFEGVEYYYYSKDWFNAKGITCDTGCAQAINSDGTFQIIGDGVIDIGNDISGEGQLWFEGLNVDGNGDMVIKEMEVRAVMAYIVHRYYKRKKDFRSAAEYNQEWVNQKAWVKGQWVKIQSRNDWPEIRNVMNSRQTFSSWVQKYKSRLAGININYPQ